MELINLSESKLNPKYVNPEQVDAVVADDGDTIVYAGQYVYKVRKPYKEVINMLGAVDW